VHVRDGQPGSLENIACAVDIGRVSTESGREFVLRHRVGTLDKTPRQFRPAAQYNSEVDALFQMDGPQMLCANRNITAAARQRDIPIHHYAPIIK
jgi:hypothetical protein